MKRYTANELVKIYTLSKQGKKTSYIAKEFHKTRWGIMTAVKILNEGMNGVQPKSKAYKKAVAILESRNSDLRGGAKSIEHQETQGSFVRMEKAQQELINSIIDLAKVQVAAQHKKEIDDLKDGYEKKLVHYQELLLASQNSSVVGVVKRKLGLAS